MGVEQDRAIWLCDRQKNWTSLYPAVLARRYVSTTAYFLLIIRFHAITIEFE